MLTIVSPHLCSSYFTMLDQSGNDKCRWYCYLLHQTPTTNWLELEHVPLYFIFHFHFRTLFVLTYQDILRHRSEIFIHICIFRALPKAIFHIFHQFLWHRLSEVSSFFDKIDKSNYALSTSIIIFHQQMYYLSWKFRS